MIPILFNYDATSFTSHGIGDLRETTSCEVVVNSEGEYELELQYPVGGEYIGSLVIDNIIVAKANDHGSYQAFRIYGVSKAINSLVTVQAQHLSYDLSGVVVKDFESTTCSGAIGGLKINAIGSLASPFTFYTDIPDSRPAENQDRKFKMEEPLTLRAALLDGDDSIYGCWGGDLVFDNYSVSLLNTAGADRGTLIEYGIDLIDMDQEENISEMITGVYPYWRGREEGEEGDSGIQDEFTVYGDIQYASGTFRRHRVIPLNVTEYFPNNTKAPTKAQINQTARDWIAANEIGQPVVNLTLSYAELGKDVRLFDAITVRFVKIGIDVKAKVISYRYDTLKERCIEVEVGSVKPSILFSLEDASRLKRGLIPPKRIANNSIDSSKLATGSVGSAELASQGVDGWHLKDSAVNSRTIEKDAVTEEKIHDWAVTTDKINGLAVTSAKIKDGAVGTLKLENSSVTHEKIGSGEVYHANLGENAVHSINIKNGEVVDAKIYAGSSELLKVNGAKLKELSVNSGVIGNSAITSVKIKNGMVDGDYGVVNGHIGNYAIDYRTVKNAEIDQMKLNDYSVTSEKIDEGGWHTNPDGSVVWNGYEPAVVTGKIGNEVIYSYHLEENLNGTIEAVATFENLVARHIDAEGVITCSALTCSGIYMIPRTITIPSSTGGNPVAVTVLAAISDGF